MRTRSTHSFATLPISKEAYEEIKQRLIARQATYPLHRTAVSEMLLMDGIALVIEPEEVKPQVCIVCGSDQHPLDVRGKVCVVCGISETEETYASDVKPELSRRDKNYYLSEENK